MRTKWTEIDRNVQKRTETNRKRTETYKDKMIVVYPPSSSKDFCDYLGLLKVICHFSNVIAVKKCYMKIAF